MPSARSIIRPYNPQDLGRVLKLWEEELFLREPAGSLGVDLASDILAADQTVAFVADSDGDLVGVAVGSADGPMGWVLSLTILGEEQDRLADRLLDHLEAALAERGVRRIEAPRASDQALGRRLETRGYAVLPDAVVMWRDLPTTVAGPRALAELGGQMVDPDLWHELQGMEEAKDIIERRVILPLARPELAARHGVVTPRAIILFGPPGTGKTTFAKGVASRLGWPFVEVEPAELAGEGPEREAKLLAEVFGRILQLPSAVVFVDEVEDLASIRHEERRVSPSVTNEFLRQIPGFRQVPHHLLVCATNWVSRLDPAFLRPGRFDYILPVGPPDAKARAAVWSRYASEITDQRIDVDALVRASEWFTPADIEFAAHKAAQLAFEREHFEGSGLRAQTADFLAAIEQTRSTLTSEMIEGFREDVERFARF